MSFDMTNFASTRGHFHPDQPTDFEPDVRDTRRLAGRAIHDPTSMKAEEIVALACALIGVLDATPPAKPSDGR